MDKEGCRTGYWKEEERKKETHSHRSARMTWYRLKKSKTHYLETIDNQKMLECLIDIFNLGGFKFSPMKARPEIQGFIDKYPYLIEEIEENQ